METINFTLTGTAPLLMHSDRFANPLDPATAAHKALTNVRKKTDEVHQDIAKSEWHGGMYFDPQIGPYIPAQNINSALIGGGKLSKLGTAIKRGAVCVSDKCELKYSGPRDPEKMWKSGDFTDMRSVKVSTSRLMRTRPIFREWSLECGFIFDPSQIRREELLQSMQQAGAFVGLGDYRPMFGRFDAEAV